jgi:hypothetical protein
MKGMNGQKKKGFRVASGQHILCITFALQSAPMSKGSDTYFVAAKGLALANRLEIKEAKNKACT